MGLSRDLRRRRARSRSLLQGLSRSALQEAGDRLAAADAAQQAAIDTIAAHLPAAFAAGLTVTQIAELTGLSRQKVYELRKQTGAGSDDLQRQILIRLAAEGA